MGFTFEVTTPLSPDQAWRRIVDVSSHGQVVPFTTGRGPSPDEATVGSRYVARTALGPIGFDDVMLVVILEAGRRVVFDKVGRLLGGTVEVELRPDGPTGARVRWRQSIELPWVPRALRPVANLVLRVLAPVICAGYRRVVTKLLDPARP